MKKIEYTAIEGKSLAYYGLLGGLGLIMLIGLLAVWHMEHEGHYVTGMTNQIVWGMPHVFAVFLIVAASGALNVASIASVFKKEDYEPLARLSGLLAIALLAGGLVVLLLDLGRPDRLIVAMTYYNFKSIFAWNIILYTGFFAIVGVYIWFMMDHNMYKFKKQAGLAAFIWRLILTTGTGSIFGFLVARSGYDAALMAPMFIIMSFAFGMAIFILVLMASYHWTGRELGDEVLDRLRSLLGVFVAAVLYFIAVYHLTNLYITEHHGFEKFILLEGGQFTKAFWIGQIILGGLVPLALIYAPGVRNNRKILSVICTLVIIGGLSSMYTVIIGGQAYPLEIFPGYEVSSSFFDGVVNDYTPSMYEIALGVGGVAVSLVLVTFIIKVLPFLPTSLADNK
ncbi:MAG: NrfD/PsrC family molybdoenzyme membrane anchor subunit [Gammaproteobacteria bacterium]|jgi:molybdopterin-containing oxidoreductase family membrane subunit